MSSCNCGCLHVVPDDVAAKASSPLPRAIKGAIAPRLAPTLSHSPRVSDADAETPGSSPSEEGVVARMVVLLLVVLVLQPRDARVWVIVVLHAPPPKTQADAGQRAVRTRSHWPPREYLIIPCLDLSFSLRLPRAMPARNQPAVVWALSCGATPQARNGYAECELPPSS